MLGGALLGTARDHPVRDDAPALEEWGESPTRESLAHEFIGGVLERRLARIRGRQERDTFLPKLVHALVDRLLEQFEIVEHYDVTWLSRGASRRLTNRRKMRPLTAPWLS